MKTMLWILFGPPGTVVLLIVGMVLVFGGLYKMNPDERPKR